MHKADCLVITKSRLFGWKNPVKSGIYQLKICNFHKNSFVCFVSRGAKNLPAHWRKTEKTLLWPYHLTSWTGSAIKIILRSILSDDKTLYINYSVLDTIIYIFTDKFNTKSRLNRSDTMRPLFFKIAHGPFQLVKWFMLWSCFRWFIACMKLFQTEFCFQYLFMLNVSYDVTHIVISGCLVHFQWKASKLQCLFTALLCIYALYFVYVSCF